MTPTWWMCVAFRNWRPGYCYGSRVDYVDKQYYGNIAEDIYDSNMKLWKVMWVASTPAQLDNYGEQVGTSAESSKIIGTFKTTT